MTLNGNSAEDEDKYSYHFYVSTFLISILFAIHISQIMSTKSCAPPVNGSATMKVKKPPSNEITPFTKFNDLSDDIKMCILSFIADVPFEGSFVVEEEEEEVATRYNNNRRPSCKSTLTHVLPLVSKKIHQLCCSKTTGDFFWFLGFQRLLQNDSVLWREGLVRILMEKEEEMQQEKEEIEEKEDEESEDDEEKEASESQKRLAKSQQKYRSMPSTILLNCVYNKLIEDEKGEEAKEGQSKSTAAGTNLTGTAFDSTLNGSVTNMLPNNSSIGSIESNLILYKHIFRSVVEQQLRYTGPVFYMPSNSVQLNRPFGLHFFEPRYRLLISEVMAKFPTQYSRGEPLPFVHNNNSISIAADHCKGWPTFVYAHQSPLCPSTPCVLVRVRQCFINTFTGGTADVLLEPFSYAWIEKVNLRPNTGGLHEVQCLRMDNLSQQQMISQEGTE